MCRDDVSEWWRENDFTENTRATETSADWLRAGGMVLASGGGRLAGSAWAHGDGSRRHLRRWQLVARLSETSEDARVLLAMFFPRFQKNYKNRELYS